MGEPTSKALAAAMAVRPEVSETGPAKAGCSSRWLTAPQVKGSFVPGDPKRSESAPPEGPRSSA